VIGKPRIGFYCSSKSYGGLEINILRILEWLGDRGWDILVFGLPDTPMILNAEKKNLKIIPVKDNHKYADIAAARRLSGLLEREGINILFIGTNKDISLGALVKSYFKKDLKLIYHQQMQIGIQKNDLLHTWRFARLDAWISPLQFLAEEVERRTRFNPEKVHVIPLCIDTGIFTQSSLTKEKALKMLKLPPNRNILGILGRIDPLKGQKFLIEAIHKLKEQNTETDLLIMGAKTLNTSDDYIDLLKKITVDLKLEDHIHFRPFAEDTVQFYKAIDVFAMATNRETFGMVTIEAMASGVPVIGNNSGGTPEILGNGKFGVLYDPGNLEDFTRKFIRLITHPAMLKEFSTQAKKEACDKYDKNTECTGFEKLILKLQTEKQ
jgi:glycosyltransferase involved in cell wall biosynthesis